MNLKHTLTQIGSTALLAVSAPATVLAQPVFENARTQLGTVQGTALGTGVTAPQDIYVIAARIINAVLGFMGIVLLGYLIYAGFLWMTSGGETEKSGQARIMITNAIIGLVIIVAAFAISNFVLGALVNVSR